MSDYSHLQTNRYFDEVRATEEFWNNTPYWVSDDGRVLDFVPPLGSTNHCHICKKPETSNRYMQYEPVDVMLWTGSHDTAFPSTRLENHGHTLPCSRIRTTVSVLFCEKCGPKIFGRMKEMKMIWHAFVVNKSWKTRPDVFTIDQFYPKVIAQLRDFLKDDYEDGGFDREDIMMDLIQRGLRQRTDWNNPWA